MSDKRIGELWGEPVSVYTSDQATENGILFDHDLLKKFWVRGFPCLLKYVTAAE